MRHAVLAAAVAFNPGNTWVRNPLVGLTRHAARVVLSLLDRRNARLDRDEPRA